MPTRIRCLSPWTHTVCKYCGYYQSFDSTNGRAANLFSTPVAISSVSSVTRNYRTYTSTVMGVNKFYPRISIFVRNVIQGRSTKKIFKCIRWTIKSIARSTTQVSRIPIGATHLFLASHGLKICFKLFCSSSIGRRLPLWSAITLPVQKWPSLQIMWLLFRVFMSLPLLLHS